MGELLLAWLLGAAMTFILSASLIFRPRLQELMATNRVLRDQLEQTQEHPDPDEVRIIPGPSSWPMPWEEDNETM